MANAVDRQSRKGGRDAKPRRHPGSESIWKEPKKRDHLPPRTDGNGNSRLGSRHTGIHQRDLDGSGTRQC